VVTSNTQTEKPPEGAVSLFKPGEDSELTWAQRLVKLQQARPGYAQPWETDAQWRALARRILEQALADAEWHARCWQRVAVLRKRHEPRTALIAVLRACGRELEIFRESDWCAHVCEIAGIGWHAYVRGLDALIVSGAA
jgi:soluble lytic murein transglycosylase-like protein